MVVVCGGECLRWQIEASLEAVDLETTTGGLRRTTKWSGTAFLLSTAEGMEPRCRAGSDAAAEVKTPCAAGERGNVGLIAS